MANVDKTVYVIVDLGLKSEAAEQWPITLLLIQLSGNGSPALASRLLHLAKSTRDARFGVHCCSWVKWNRRRASWRNCSAAPWWCLKHRISGYYSYVSGKYMLFVYMCVCRCCINQQALTDIHTERFTVALSLTAQWHIVIYCSRQWKQQWPLILLLSSLRMFSCFYMYSGSQKHTHPCQKSKFLWWKKNNKPR